MKLTREFYDRPTLDVARDLLGKTLVRRLGGRSLSGMIVETEAYIGPDDLACHASKGRTPRTATMFGPAGFAYVYMIYGFYFCLNTVTETEGYPAAVLIRAVEPLENVALMRRMRKNPPRDIDIASGPGKLCMAMGIDKTLNGADLSGGSLWVEDRNTACGPVLAAPRIGVDYAGEYRLKPWRLFVENNPHVSRIPRRPPAAPGR
ncbi:MAG TPA: DNA-3-methyladenine glycosylase [Terriglobia bacterium]|nr:DNA-3-methyladenine glycosylase [Terriglobia bacterium]